MVEPKSYSSHVQSNPYLPDLLPLSSTISQSSHLIPLIPTPSSASIPD